MSFGTFRELALDLNFDFAHGTPATITRPDLPPVSTYVIPSRHIFDDAPTGREFEARDPRRLFAVRRDVFTELERGTIINAAERQGGTAIDWQVDGIEETTEDHFMVRVIQKPS